MLQAKVFLLVRTNQCTCLFTVLLLIPSVELEAAQTKRQSHLGHLEVMSKLVFHLFMRRKSLSTFLVVTLKSKQTNEIALHHTSIGC